VYTFQRSYPPQQGRAAEGFVLNRQSAFFEAAYLFENRLLPFLIAPALDDLIDLQV
jgi:hypothetical protein